MQVTLCLLRTSNAIVMTKFLFSSNGCTKSEINSLEYSYIRIFCDKQFLRQKSEHKYIFLRKDKIFIFYILGLNLFQTEISARALGLSSMYVTEDSLSIKLSLDSEKRYKSKYKCKYT